RRDDGIDDSVELHRIRLRGGGARYGDLSAESRRGLRADGWASKSGWAAKASVSHNHSRLRVQERRAGDELRRDGRHAATARPCAGHRRRLQPVRELPGDLAARRRLRRGERSETRRAGGRVLTLGVSGSGFSRIEYPTTLVRGHSGAEHSLMAQLVSHAFSRPLAAADIVRSSVLGRSVSRLVFGGAMPSATRASGFPDPYRVIDAFL